MSVGSAEYITMKHLNLPPAGHPLRAGLDDALLEGRAFPLFREVLWRAREFFAAEPVARSLVSLAQRADGALWLIEVRRSGTWRRRWVLRRV